MTEPCGAILLAEDDENDVLFMQMALARSGIPYRLMVVRNGEQAVQYLSGEGIYADRQRYPMPSLLLLDLGMPVLSGLEVLEWLQHGSAAREFVVVVLTSSPDPSDIERARSLGADDYRVKPSNAADLTPMLLELQARWLAPGQNRLVAERLFNKI
ncbi:MAG: response regulator [Verrucomicrobiia bacterium]